MQALKMNGITFISFDQGKKQKDVVDQFLNDKRDVDHSSILTIYRYHL